nr:hypothetical protein CFP56_62741 [Quercus suber]
MGITASREHISLHFKQRGEVFGLCIAIVAWRQDVVPELYLPFFTGSKGCVVGGRPRGMQRYPGQVSMQQNLLSIEEKARPILRHMFLCQKPSETETWCSKTREILSIGRKNLLQASAACAGTTPACHQNVQRGDIRVDSTKFYRTVADWAVTERWDDMVLS